MKTKGRWTPNEQRLNCHGIGQIMIRDVVESRTTCLGGGCDDIRGCAWKGLIAAKRLLPTRPKNCRGLVCGFFDPALVYRRGTSAETIRTVLEH